MAGLLSEDKHRGRPVIHDLQDIVLDGSSKMLSLMVHIELTSLQAQPHSRYDVQGRISDLHTWQPQLISVLWFRYDCNEKEDSLLIRCHIGFSAVRLSIIIMFAPGILLVGF